MEPTPAAKAWLGRILHTTDFSPDGQLAFAHALKLALAARGELNIVHVDLDGDQTNNDWADFPAVRSTLAAWGMLDADAPTTAVAEQLGVKVTKLEIGSGSPFDGITALARRHPIDLTVMASRAYEGLDRWRRPSTAEKMARRVDSPALFLPHEATGFVDPETGAVRLRTILVPIDAHPRPEAAVHLALTVAHALGAPEAEVVLLHVGDDPPDVLDFRGQRQDFPFLLRSGPVVDVIAGTAHEIDADLIVMATEGHDGLLDVLRGSTTEQVLRRAKRALIAVPAA